MHHLRPAVLKDGSEITRIMNIAIQEGQNGYVNQLKNIIADNWFNTLYNNSLCLISVEIDSLIVGWGSLTEYRGGRPSFDGTLEISFYVDPKFKRQGIGNSLVMHLEQEARKMKIETLIAILLGDNMASINLLKSHMYSEWGRMPNAAVMAGSSVDHLYYGKHLTA